MGDILFLAHRVPFPPNRGDKIRAHHLLHKLARLGPVHVGCLAESAEDRAGEAEVAKIAASHCVASRNKPLALAGAEAVLARKPVSLTAFHNARLNRWVTQTIAKNDIATIVIFSGQMGQYIPRGFGGRVVIDLCDVDSAKFEGYADAGERVWINAREARLLAREEERLGRRADATILISENEADLYRTRLSAPDGINVQVIGNGIDTDFFGGNPVTDQSTFRGGAGPHFVFTGQMDYRPNEQAALWVIEQLMPRIRAAIPSAQFHVVGRNPTTRLLEKHGIDGISVTGEVPDVRPYLASADIVLAPLLIARGVQNKVLEAMAMRCPVLLTPQAAIGIAAKHGRDWSICDAEPDAMCAAAISLWHDDEARQDMATAARRFVIENHAWDAMLEPLGPIVCCKAGEARDAA